MASRELGHRDERRRRRAQTRIEQLTKTTRRGGVGPKSPWLRWYREFGDFLRYNPELERVEIDKERKAANRAASVDGLSLRVVGDADDDLTAQDFVALGASESARTTIELTALVEGDLAPGMYAVSATYRNAHNGESLGLGGPDGPPGQPWVGQPTSPRLRFRIVPW